MRAIGNRKMNSDQALPINLLTTNNYKGLVPDKYETAYVWNNNRTNMQVLLPAYTNAVLFPTCNNRVAENVSRTGMQQNVAYVGQDNMCFSGLNTIVGNEHCISSRALSSNRPERSYQYTKHSQTKEGKDNVGKLELTEIHYKSNQARTLNIDWCTDQTGLNYRFMIERNDPDDINTEPLLLTSTCKDIDVCFDDENKEIIVKYKYLNKNLDVKEGTIHAPYMRATQSFEDHEHTDQKKAVEQFLKLSAVNTGEDKQVIDGEERLFKNYQARSTRHTPVHELSSDPVQISKDILTLQEKWKEIQHKLQIILTDHADMNDLIQSILSMHWKMD